MIQKLKFLLPVLALAISGCANTPKEGINYGSTPNDEEQKEELMKHLKRSLFDFDSMKQFQIAAPKKCFWKKGSTGMLFETTYGWCYVYELNAKNRYGAYTGIQRDIWKVYTGGTKGSMLTVGEGFEDGQGLRTGMQAVKFPDQ
jgi:hypothetical protein